MTEPKYEVGDWFTFKHITYNRTRDKKYQITEQSVLDDSEIILYYVDDNKETDWVFAKNTIPCKAPEPEIDTGADLIGRRIRRGNGTTGTLEKHPIKADHIILEKYAGGKKVLLISKIRKWFEIGTWTFVDEPVKGYTREELLKLHIKVRCQDTTFRMEAGYNHNVLRRVDVETNKIISTTGISEINHYIKQGDYIVVQGETSKSESTEPDIADRTYFVTSSEKLLRFVIDKDDPKYCSIEDALDPENNDKCRWKVVEAVKHFVNGNWKIIPDPAKQTHMFTCLRETQSPWQQYNPYTEEYSCDEPKFIKIPEEEETMLNKRINITVSPDAFATRKVDTIYAVPVEEMSEEDLFNALRRIQSDQANLESLGAGEASKRITAKIKTLVDAREKVIKAIDALDKKK